MARKKRSVVLEFLWDIFKFLGNAIWFLVKLPFDLIEWLFKFWFGIVQKTSVALVEKKIERKREAIFAKYKGFEVEKIQSGSFSAFEQKIMKADTIIGIIVGARGSGKTATGMKLLENVYAKTKRPCYALGFSEENLPSWINVVESTSEIPNGAFVLIDEGGILFSARRAMSNVNKLLSELLLIARHKNLSIAFIAQNSSNLEVNAIRQADYLILKASSLLQKDFERKVIKELYENIEKDFSKFKDVKGTSYIYSDQFKGFVSNELPSFWNTKISKSFSNKK